MEKILGEVLNDNVISMKQNKKKHKKNSNKRNNGCKQINGLQVPTEIWLKIFSYCDPGTLESLKMTCVRFYNIIDANSNLDISNNGYSRSGFANMPSEIILSVFAYLNKADLAKCSRVCKRFRDLTAADCLWINEAKQSLATNNGHPEMKSRSVQPWISAQDRVRISQNWIRGQYHEL